MTGNFISFLKGEKAYGSFVNNLKKNPSPKTPKTLAAYCKTENNPKKYIDNAFDWNKTREKSDFWYFLAEKWEQKCSR